MTDEASFALLGGWGHAPPENIETYRFWNAVLSIVHEVFFQELNLEQV